MFLTSIVETANARKHIPKYRYVTVTLETSGSNGVALYMLKFWDKNDVEIPFVDSQVTVSAGTNKIYLSTDIANSWNVAFGDVPVQINIDFTTPKPVNKMGYVLGGYIDPGGLGESFDPQSLRVNARNNTSDTWLTLKPSSGIAQPKIIYPNYTMFQLFP